MLALPLEEEVEFSLFHTGEFQILNAIEIIYIISTVN